MTLLKINDWNESLSIGYTRCCKSGGAFTTKLQSGIISAPLAYNGGNMKSCWITKHGLVEPDTNFDTRENI